MNLTSASVDPSNLKNEHNQLFLALMEKLELEGKEKKRKTIMMDQQKHLRALLSLQKQESEPE